MTGEKDTAGDRSASLARRHRTVAASCGVAVAAMVGLAYASVPLYRLFCQVTGFGGTTQKAERPSDLILERTITVRFDSTVASNMPWRFEPVQRAVNVRIGENALAFYRATNISDHPVTGTAVFNVTPEVAGIHFQKIECFCFKEQTLAPGETAELPVTFFIDPNWVKDKDAANISQITLSYTFYPVAPAANRAAQRPAARTDKGS